MRSLGFTACPLPHEDSYGRHGISRCDVNQLSKKRRVQLNKELTNNRLIDALQESPDLYKTKYYSIGGLDMNLGRAILYSSPKWNVAKLTTESKRNNSKYNMQTSLNPIYSGYNEAFQKDLWTAQVLALWLTDAEAYSQFHKNNKYMKNIITKSGHSPNNLLPLRIDSQGHAILNLYPILKKPSNQNQVSYIKGPDGIYGPASEDVISEWIRTGKLFGKSVPSNAQQALNRLAENVSSPAIQRAKAQKQAGQTKSKTKAKDTPGDALSKDAQDAAGYTPPSKTPKTPIKRITQAVTEGEDNTMLYVGGGLLALGVVGVVAYKKYRG